MVILTLKTIPPQQHKADFIDAFHSITDQVRRQKGCLEYELYANTEKPQEVFLFER